MLGIQCKLISQCGGKLNLINARKETAIKVEKFAIKDLVKGKARSSKRSKMSQLFIDSNIILKKNYDTKECSTSSQGVSTSKARGKRPGDEVEDW